ncbi:MAG: cob(I)yrinic acid a,c-diamide adenosyltransferase [Planctomycetes bacterium]|jgi:cob(I)alamin adenosyltransferase|nr:cob(I)yrinic acid a,c-diamide adenosyltransferase [Planctomycetota bacterium]
MVYLSRIYTKTGDTGDTALGDGSRVAKDHPRVAAYGSVDELNALLGVFLASVRSTPTPGSTPKGREEKLEALIRSIQNDLFDVGADLCVPIQLDDKALRVVAAQAESLESEIDQFNEHLQPLRSFILPGGTTAAAWCHLARTVCRRAERDVVTLSHAEPVNPQVIVYLNRLSDLLFVLARICNGAGSEDVLWIPGKSRSDQR